MLDLNVKPLHAMLRDMYPDAFPEPPVTRPHGYITPNHLLTDRQIFAITDAHNRRMRGW